MKEIYEQNTYPVLSKRLGDRIYTSIARVRGQKTRCYALDENGVKNFEVSNGKIQFIVSELLTLLNIPASPIFKDNKLDGWFSEDADKQIKSLKSNFDKDNLKKIKFESDSFILGLVFNDIDHKTNHNEKEGIFFDFDSACIYFSDERIEILRSSIQERFQNEKEYIIDNYNQSMQDSFYQDVKTRIINFYNDLNIKKGSDFIGDIFNKSGFTEYNSEEIRLSILKWLDVVLEELNKFLINK